MKPLSKILSLSALALATCFAVESASAQQTIATWQSNPLSSGGGAPPAPFTNNTANPNVIVFPMTKGSGIGVVSTASVYGGNTWTNAGLPDSEANSIANGLYITYAIQAAPGYTVSFATNILSYHNSATGPFNGEIQYSTDGVNYSDIYSIAYAAGNVAETTFTTNVLAGVAELQNVPSTITNFFRIVNWGATGTAGTWYMNNSGAYGTTNDFLVLGVVQPSSLQPPANAVISPIAETVGYSGTATFSITATGSPATYSWYQVVGTTTNLLAGQTGADLTLSGVTAANAGLYFAVLNNAAGSATSTVATLTVNDPVIQIQPNYSYGLVDGQVQFAVTATGSAPLSYQWYYADANSNVLSQVGSTTVSGATISGATSNVLTLSNVQVSDPTNFVVVIANSLQSVTSSVVSLLYVTNIYYTYFPPYFDTPPPITPIAFWDFNGSEFTNTALNPGCMSNPVPYLGVGTAMAVGSCNDPGTSPFSGADDPNDETGFDFIIPGIEHDPDFAWGTSAYPANSSTVNSNKLNGVQFNVSTVGAKNVLLTYDSRGTGTASDFERVQYTTNGTTWIDYPSSSSFNGIASTFESYQNDFSGFPGVANNPNFGVRIVTEFESTATYGIGPSNDFVGVANTYGTAGTVTYDLVGFFGDAITNNNIPPVLSPFTNVLTGQIVTNETTVDTTPLTNTFTVSGDSNPANFTYSAVSLNSSSVNPSVSFHVTSSGSGTMIVTPNNVSQPVVAGPILVTVTDTNGDVTKGWFDLTVITKNQPPTNSLTTFTGTNTLVNTALAIPFMVGSLSNSVSQFTYSGSSGNNTVVPSANIVVTTNSPGTPTNPVVTITPAVNQLGVATISVAVNDNNSQDPKTTTATFPFMVRPNTNVVGLDFFNYDSSGALDTISDGYWQHLSGNFGQMQVSSSPSGGSVVVDTLNNTENLQSPLLGAPYSTNANASVTTLYYSFVVNLNNPGNMPNANGTYIATFNDGSGNTADVNDLFVIGTNGAAPGYYRVGIANDVGATANNAYMVPVDLLPGSNYVILTSLTVSNGQSSIWIDPTNGASPNVTAPVDDATIAYNVSDFELRESGGESGNLAGAVTVSFVKVGTTFDSVLQTPQANTVTYAVPFGATFSTNISSLSTNADWFDPNGLPMALTYVGPTSLNGTNVTTDGTSIYYGGPVVSYDSFSYGFGDQFESGTGTVSLAPFLQFNGAQSVNASGNPTISGNSPVGAAGYAYGVESRTNLVSGAWIEAGNVTVKSDGSWSFTDANQTNPPVIFYRIYYPDNPGNPPQ